MFRLGDRFRPPSFMGCTCRSFGFDCAYTINGGGLMMRVTGGASAGWMVQTVTALRAVAATS
jgi:hypothetical protein